LIVEGHQAAGVRS